jgi:acetyl esterase
VVANAARLGLDPRRVAVGGDSAGGNLATVVALMVRERGDPALVHQVLIYPVTDHDPNTQSYIENATGYVLTREGMRRSAGLAGLPSALVITAECDPLRDEGEAYAGRLRDAGVPVTLTRYAGMFHGFVRMTRILDQARTALDEIAGSLQKAFAAALVRVARNRWPVASPTSPPRVAQ